jgi:lysophospholipase L1-like esterase
MKNFKQAILFALCCFLFSCSGVEEPIENSDAKNIIMPLGASRVEGARPDFESYRYELWKLLIENESDFDFVGTNTDEAQYDDYLGKSFDKDHEGWSGWTSGQIKRKLNNWLKQIPTPDIVLFSSPGGNDALQNKSYDKAIMNINEIIDLLQAKNPNVTIIIESMAPAITEIMEEPLSSFVNNMQQDVYTIAENKGTSNSKILVVDMASGFGDEHLADDVHYNEKGAKFIAERYFQSLQSVLKK